MKVLAVIPARAGSRRIPNKNRQELGGVALWELAETEAACAALIDDWVVTTDDPDVCNKRVHRVERPHALADGPMAPVLLHALHAACAMWEEDPSDWEAVCCVQPTSPFRSHGDIDACIGILLFANAGSVVSIDETTGERNGAVYVTRVSMLRDGLVFDDHSLKYPMPHDRSIDINYPEDLEKARAMWAKLHG